MKKILTTLLIFFTVSVANAAQPLVEANWLKKNLKNKNIKVIEISSKFVGGSYDNFKQGHIPGSVYLDHIGDKLIVTKKNVIGQLPEKKDLEGIFSKLGVKNSDHIVISYLGVNSLDFGSAARLYWTLKTSGHEEVSILNGGKKSWLSAGYGLEKGDHKITASKFRVKYNNKYDASYKDVRDAKRKRTNYALIDARPKAFFTGEKKHPKIKRFGTIPTSVNIEEATIVDGAVRVKSADEIKAIFAKANVNGKEGYISYCNTGWFASTIWFALSEVAQIPNVKLYDGSVAHWELNPYNELVNGV
jgi:thiosulfate/3-mercaptopyruvate sulfurtransferase